MSNSLKKYGRHLRSCELFRQPRLTSTDSHYKCTCGFSEALGCDVCGGKGYVVNLDLSDYAGRFLADSGFLTGNCPECGKV